MRLVGDLLPLAAFFVGYKLGDIFVATAAIMVAMPVQLLLLRLTGRRIETVHKATFALIVLFGALTLVLRDGAFIQWKSTVINLVFGASLLFAHKVLGRNLVSMMLSGMVSMGERDWALVSHLLAGFFFFMAALNTVLIYSVSEETWVNIKTFGYPVLSILACGSVMAVAFKRAALADEDEGTVKAAAPGENASAPPPEQLR